MTWTEFIHIRAYSGLEAKDIVTAFYQLSETQTEVDLSDITLLRNRRVATDFCIRMTWHGDLPKKEKSRLGYQLTEAFSKMGLINHSIWLRETGLFQHDRRYSNGKK